ncbi:hypothetical protein ACZ90_55345 [Streptomyces albus subsp. albus]|nr:hypothetical protein ACZ90_55345 [Streptomyces albus subsp. albus]
MPAAQVVFASGRVEPMVTASAGATVETFQTEALEEVVDGVEGVANADVVPAATNRAAEATTVPRVPRLASRNLT